MYYVSHVTLNVIEPERNEEIDYTWNKKLFWSFM